MKVVFILLAYLLMAASTAFAELKTDPASSDGDAVQMAEMFMNNVSEEQPKFDYTSRRTCFELGKSTAGAFFLYHGKSATYKRPGPNPSLSTEDALEFLRGLAMKFCAANLNDVLTPATGETWEQVSANLIRASYEHRSPYDREIFRSRHENDGQDGYDENAPNNPPKSLALYFEMGVLDILIYNAYIAHAFEPNYTYSVVKLPNGKEIPFDQLRYNNRYLRAGANNFKKLSLP